jgi:hypothetical protein
MRSIITKGSCQNPCVGWWLLSLTNCFVLFGRNVLQQDLHNCFTLPESENYDAVLCSTIADVDMDGRHEILLGTYGQVRQYWVVKQY